MSLNRLFTIAEGRAPIGNTTRLAFPVRADHLDMIDELAADIGISRAQVAREACQIGVQQLYAEWQQAQENAKAEKKASKAQARLKLAPGDEEAA